MGTDLTGPTNPGEALLSKTRQRLLKLFFGHPDERFYQRHVIQEAGLGSGTVQRDLARLVQAGILTRTPEGHQVYFQANRRCPIFHELDSLVRKTFGVVKVLEQALKPIAGRIAIAFVFGSIATGKVTSSSDIDILVVGEVSLADVVSALADAQRDLGRETNPVVCSLEELCRKLAEGHHFLSRVVAGVKLFLIGDPDELARLVQERMAQRAQEQPGGNHRSVRGGGSRSGSLPHPRSTR